VAAQQLVESIHPTSAGSPEPAGDQLGEDPAGTDDSQGLGADQFLVHILPTGRVLYEFGSHEVAARFFGQKIVANQDDLRVVLGELLAGTAGSQLRTARPAATDRNLVTTREFAEALNCAESSVFEMLKLGLPSIKSPKLGRRILKSEALAWLQAGGATRSRTAKRLRKTNGAGHGG